ncbi:MAG: flagellar basal body protein, partial [Novosphingobium sp.]
MSSDLLSIARSGSQAARAALDVTAQNIANASSEGYVRRSARLTEVVGPSGLGRIGETSLSGVRLSGVVRNADMFRQAEVRRTGSDAARASAELTGLENVETAIEQANVFPAVVEFEAALQRLSADPVNPSLRAAVVEDARTMTRAFGIASSSLDAVGEGLRFEAGSDVDQVNVLAGELARVNTRLARTVEGSGDRAMLLDQRDNLLQNLSERVDVTTSFSADQTVEVRLGGAGGPALVSRGTASPLAMATGADGTIGFTVGGAAVTPGGGSLAGRAQALDQLADARDRLDLIAVTLVATVNGAQANGAALDGTPGQPMLSGTSAADMALTFDNGDLIATAPAGSDPGSRDAGNLTALRDAIASADPAGA